VPVDRFRDARARVPYEIGDGLDGYALVTHDGDERVTQLTGTHSVPTPASSVIFRNVRRTFAASSRVPTLMQNARP
jgi:hypothetical protein